MSEKVQGNHIVLKEYIHEKEYKDLTELSNVCTSNDDIILKLELDYKLNVAKESENNNNLVNEFLYYINDEVVSYIGISSFGGNVAELNGMTNPKYRKEGLFKKLFQLAMDECRRRNYNEILLLSDNASESGNEFIKLNGGVYKCSEYSMEYMSGDKLINNNSKVISLKKADKTDSDEIKNQDAIYWGKDLGEGEIEFIPNTDIYMIKKSDNIIGKINVEYDEDYAYIFGFGIKPEYRCNGYGRAALIEVVNTIIEKGIKNIKLDVACENITALNLYKECGFEQKSVMNYYKIL